MRLRPLAVGLATFIPGAATLQKRLSRVRGSDSARYCYTVWMRHLVMARRHGRCARVPPRVAELGPGESIGIGLAALLSGAVSYVGLDVLPRSNLGRNRAVFDELVELFKSRAPLPTPDEFPKVRPELDSYAFPHDLLPELSGELDSQRLARLRRAIETPNLPGSPVRYIAPWDRADVVEPGSVDMIFSQAVLQHVDDLPGAYRAMASWLAPGGFVSHTLDLSSHSLTRAWNGHWAQSDFAWKLLRGRRAYLLNRAPHSGHVEHLRNAGFAVACEIPEHWPSAIARHELAPRFAHLSDSDLTTRTLFVQARL